MVRRCKATTVAGPPCSAQPVRADGYCWWHSPALANERDEARRRGGSARSNRARAKKQLPAVEPGVGSSVASLARAYVAVTEAGAVETLEREVAELRDLIATRGSA